MPNYITERVSFLHYAIRQVFQAAGATELHANYVADGITFAHLQGKQLQGLGVYEALDLPLVMGSLDLSTKPEMIAQGPAWAVVDGNRSSGYYCLNIMADIAMDIASTSGIAIVFGGNHNDGGSFASYVYRAQQAGFFAMASNNTVPLAAPWGGKENRLSCPPFDAMVPNGEQPPIWVSTMLAEFYDAHVAQAVHSNEKLTGDYAIDPDSGQVSDDLRPYAQQINAYTRVFDATCAGQLSSPRMFSLNLWNEALTAIVNPIGIPSTELPTVADYAENESREEKAALPPSVGGSYFLCIDPSALMPDGLAKTKSRSDAYTQSILNTPSKPDESVRMPGQNGYSSLQRGDEEVKVICQHWDTFFEHIAPRYGLSEAILRQNYR